MARTPARQEEGIPEREWHESHHTQPKSQNTALLLAIFLGIFGIDRLYLRNSWQGFLKWASVGGFFIWWYVDIWRIASGKEIVDGFGTPLRFDLVGSEKNVGYLGLGLAIVSIVLLPYASEQSTPESTSALVAILPLSAIAGLMIIFASRELKKKVDSGLIPEDGIWKIPSEFSPELEAELNQKIADLEHKREAAVDELSIVKAEFERERASTTDFSSIQSEIENLTAILEETLHQKQQLEAELEVEKAKSNVVQNIVNYNISDSVLENIDTTIGKENG